MHVLVVPRGLYEVPSLPIHGVFESQQVAALREAGLQTGVLSGGVITTRHLGRRFPYERQQVAAGVPVYRAYRRALFPARWEKPDRAAELTYRRVRPQLSRYIAHHGRPDVVHAHNLALGGLIAQRILADTGIPYVVTEHTSTYAADLASLQADAASLSPAFRDASCVVAVGESLAINLRLAFDAEAGERVEVVPNVVDHVLLDAPLTPRPQPYTVAGLGYLIPRKNYGMLIEAFSRAQLPPDAVLVIGGEGPEANRLKKLAKSLGVADRLHLPGALDRSQVQGLLQGASIFAHPSNSESFGVVLIEAMALGLPVLATASNGPVGIVTPDVGLLTPVGDAQAFADGLSQMYARREDFDPARLRTTCRDRFGPRRFASRMLEIYQRAIA